MSRLFIFCEESSGGCQLAAYKHFMDCILDQRDVYLATPATVVKNNFEPDRVMQINFPKSIKDLRGSLELLVAINKMKIQRNDVIFSHSIRSGFLLSIFTLKRVHVLIHRHIGKGTPIVYKLFLIVSHIFFSKLYCVSPPEIFKRKIIFFPILSPFILRKKRMYASPGLSSKTTKKNKSLRILWLSRLTYPKRPHVLLKALENISPERYFVTFVGTGYYRDQITCSINSSKINGQIIDEGNPLTIIESHDVIVLISDFEGIPFVLQEAMFMNKLVLCSDLPGTRFLGADSFIYINDENIVDKINSLFDDSQKTMYRSLIYQQWNRISKIFNSSYKELT